MTPRSSSAVLTNPAPSKPTLPAAGTTPSAVLHVSAREQSAIGARLGQLGCSFITVADAAEAVLALRKRLFALALVDLADDRVAIAAIRAIHAQKPQLRVAGLLDPTDPLVAAEAIRAGVSDLVSWPLDEREILAMVSNARDQMTVTLPGDSTPASTAGMLFVNSPAMRVLMERVRGAAVEIGGVLLSGERGTGRELVARAIHEKSTRAERLFVAVDCKQSLHELEECLFGVITDRRPGGVDRRATERIGLNGAIFQADGGTLYLINIVDAPTRVQAKLARLLRDGEASVHEERAVIDLDVRPIAAVDAGLDAAIADERIRRDLYDRLAQIRIDVPPLRRRREDIPLIATSLLREVCEQKGVPIKVCSRAALVLLSALPWPDNGRDLRALLETLVTSVTKPIIQLDDLFEHVRLDGLAARVEAGGTLRDAKARFERDWISAVLMKHHGRVGEAAKALGIQRTNLYRKVRQLKVARTLLGPRKIGR